MGSTAAVFYFSAFPVTRQVFYRTTLSFAIVNLKPLLPGHILVCPRRVVPRLHDLTADEVADLFAAVQCVGAALERIYRADALSIAIQDGVVAGQSVPHVHAHIIPRLRGDLPEDEIYKLLESDDAHLGVAHAQQQQQQQQQGETECTGAETPSSAQLAPGLGKEPNRTDALRTKLLLEKSAAAAAAAAGSGGGGVGRAKFPMPETERVPRSEEEMEREARWLEGLMRELEA